MHSNLRSLKVRQIWIDSNGKTHLQDISSETKKTSKLVINFSNRELRDKLYACAISIHGLGYYIPVVYAVYEASRRESLTYRPLVSIVTINGTAICPKRHFKTCLQAYKPKVTLSIK